MAKIPAITLIIFISLLVGYGIGWISLGTLGVTNRNQSLYNEDLVKSLFDKASPSVVEINVLTLQSQSSSDKAIGSGFIVNDKGHVVTNYHVIADATDVTVRLYNGRELNAVTLGTSPADDLALLQIDPEKVSHIRPLKLADADDIHPGQLAVAIGSPFRELNSISVGVVSGIGRSRRSILNRPIPDLIQTDAALNPGNSGGPLLNSSGEVIGVNSSVKVVSSIQIGVGFAISIKTLNSILPDLMRSEEIKRPWIGIAGESLNKTSAKLQGVSTDKGIYITRVCQGSPAAAARLLGSNRFPQNGMGDIITEVDDLPMESLGDLVSYINDLHPGDRVTLTVVRKNQEYRVEVGLDEWKACE